MFVPHLTVAAIHAVPLTFMWVLGTQAQAFTLTQQVLLHLSHLLSPSMPRPSPLFT